MPAPQTIRQPFRLYLKARGLSPVSIKNYLSDLNHFWRWFMADLKAQVFPFANHHLQTLLAQITPQRVAAYQKSLLATQTATKTINRRLSTLRRFSQFCLAQGWLSANPTEAISNVGTGPTTASPSQAETILAEFKTALKADKISPITVKNYLSDVRYFLAWLEAS